MIPTTLKQQLLALSCQLDPTQRSGFLRNVVHRLENLALTYPRTLVFSCAGLLVGRLLESLSGFPVTFPITLLGGLFGLHRDLNADEATSQVQRIIGEEFQAHQSRP